MTSPKVERTKKLLLELKADVANFFSLQPYTVGTKRDPQTRKLIYFVTKVDDIPITIPTLAGDIIQNLRSALDHVAYRLFISNSSGSARHIYFPIATDRLKYQTNKIGQTKGMSQQAIDLIDSVGPYKEGNNTLWRIHELNLIDKHRTLITSGSSFQSVDLGAHMMETMRKSFPERLKDFPSIPLFIRPADNLFPLKTGAELFIDGPDAQEIPNMEFKFQVVLNETGIVEGEPVIEVLESMVSEVEKQTALFDPLFVTNKT